MTDRHNSMIGWVGAGIAFALMQITPFRWAIYLLAACLGLLAVQDWWSEHEIPSASSDVEWAIETQDVNSSATESQPVYAVTGWFRNHGTEVLESAVLSGRLYECPQPEDTIDRCIPVAESRTPLTLDLKPGFLTHFSVYPSFRGAGGPNPRVTWNMREIIADDDWLLD